MDSTYASVIGILISYGLRSLFRRLRKKELGNLGVHKGALYENFVAEAFLKQGLGLYYYRKENSTLEEEFFVRTAHELLPVEVKVGGNRSKSLTTLIKSERYPDIKRGIKLGDCNVGQAGSVYTFPYFGAFMIREYLRSWK